MVVTKRGFYTHRATQHQIISNPSVELDLSSIYARKQAVREVRNLVTYCKICAARKLAHIQNPIQLGNTCNLFVIRDVNIFRCNILWYPELHSTWLNLWHMCISIITRLALMNSQIKKQCITCSHPRSHWVWSNASKILEEWIPPILCKFLYWHVARNSRSLSL